MIDTYLGAQKAYTSQLVVGDPTSPIRGAIAAGVAIATGVANVAAIAKTKTPGTSKGGGGGGSTPSKPSVPAFDPTAALDANAEGQSIDNQITIGENSQSQPVVKAFVVSDDMTTQQEKDKKINDLARL